jgi:hypothetical protein
VRRKLQRPRTGAKPGLANLCDTSIIRLNGLLRLSDPDSGGRVLVTRNFDFKFAALAILCIVFAFFFPAVRGSYSAVHGPVTALRSVRERVTVWLVLALAALHRWGHRLLTGCLSVLGWTCHAVFLAHDPPNAICLLRC